MILNHNNVFSVIDHLHIHVKGTATLFTFIIKDLLIKIHCMSILFCIKERFLSKFYDHFCYLLFDLLVLV